MRDGAAAHRLRDFPFGLVGGRQAVHIGLEDLRRLYKSKKTCYNLSQIQSFNSIKFYVLFIHFYTAHAHTQSELCELLERCINFITNREKDISKIK